eukprot:6213560-Pleurochrysis_carterae.AAC.2
MLVGGDVLAVNRINHTINQFPKKYLRTPPAVIPIQGEHPHGTCQILQMGWRPYAPLLMGILAAIGHNECRSDFTVSKFNNYDGTTRSVSSWRALQSANLSDQTKAKPLT